MESWLLGDNAQFAKKHKVVKKGNAAFLHRPVCADYLKVAGSIESFTKIETRH